MTIEENLDAKWEGLRDSLSARFDERPDEQAILYLIGLQELGKNYQRFSKDQKLDIIHIAICTLLEPYGYYEYIGRDKDGWPHWERTQKLPNLKPIKQANLIREAIVAYFD